MAALADVMDELRALGTAHTAKTYRRHGATGEVYGVSYADLGKLKKRIKVDHPLALALWQSGNHDARVLATMVADPAQMAEADIDCWVDDADNYGLASAVGTDVAARMPGAAARMERWIDSDDEWRGRAGWRIAAALALNDQSLPDSYFERLLAIGEARIHTSKNRVRDAINDTVIAIGGRNPSLRARAAETARRIGKVEVDHGDTACETPDAAAYIDKMWARRAAKTKTAAA
jgi:3-methyladenine DNA glycosylase AlkD